MKKIKKTLAIFLVLTLMLVAVPTSFAAESTAVKLGDVTVNFSSGYSVEQKDINPDGDIPIMGDVYHVAQDCILTITYGGSSDKWEASYSPLKGEAGVYKAELTAPKEIKAKYFENVADAKNSWNAGNKEILPILEKTDASIGLTYKDAEGYLSGETLRLNFDGKGTASTSAPQIAVTVPNNSVQPALVTSGKLKTTAGLYGVLPPLPTPGQDLSYTVQLKETLGGIAFNYYGSMSSKTVSKIKSANAAYFKKTKGVLEAGAVITLPKAGLINPVAPVSLKNAAGAYLVKRGDTLVDISKVYYGNKNSWRKIYEANKDRVKLVGKSAMIYEKQWLIIPN